jgi:hypothetical protein
MLECLPITTAENKRMFGAKPVQVEGGDCKRLLRSGTCASPRNLLRALLSRRLRAKKL